MAIRSFRTRGFRRRLESLPPHVQRLAYGNFLLWKANPWHPSLHFKKVRGEQWSARIGAHYRATGNFAEDGFIWIWIGSHAEYDQLMRGG